MVVDNGSVADFVEKRDKAYGRRDTDTGRCAVHDFLHDKNDSCLAIIKNSIRDEVQKRDHKFEDLEARLETYMTKWAVGIIVLISATTLGGFASINLWQLDTLHTGQQTLTAAVMDLTKSVVVVGERQVSFDEKQKNVLKILEEIVPEHKRLLRITPENLSQEHKELMEHLEKRNQHDP